MRRCLRQNATNVYEIYIGRPIHISDVQYLYPMSDIYIRHPGTYIRHPGTYIRHPGTYIRHPGTYIRCPTSARARAMARAGISDVGYRYRTSDIYIGHRIYILDVRYIYWTSDIDFGNIGGILS